MAVKGKWALGDVRFQVPSLGRVGTCKEHFSYFAAAGLGEPGRAFPAQYPSQAAAASSPASRSVPDWTRRCPGVLATSLGPCDSV